MSSNVIYEELRSIEYEPRHLNRYIEFIEVCKSNPPTGYCEKHHILPRSLFPNEIDNPNNIIKLSARQHFLAHMILAYTYGGPMSSAFYLMAYAKKHFTQYRKRLTARQHERMRLLFAEYIRTTRDFSGENNPMYGKRGEDCPFYGIKRTSETIQKMKEARAKVPNVTCPHCGKSGHPSGMQRWHFDNCGKSKELWSGTSNPNGKRIGIFDKDDRILYTCEGDFASTCERYGLPRVALHKSYTNNGRPIFNLPYLQERAIKQGRANLIGMYAKAID